MANKTGSTRLGFCLMLKFYEIEARFPEFIEESRRRRWSTPRIW
ncbi:hypothetical protein [Streptomyces sp. NBC_00582]|nr:hypothetical protein [Streptomyces sp. NBC_00582]WUB59341.1 hypothetical protein OG852_02425 [Streptomyces sp. NBC_00582]